MEKYYLVLAYYFDNERDEFDWHPLNYGNGGIYAVSDDAAIRKAEVYYQDTCLAKLPHIELCNFMIVEREMIDKWGDRVIDNRWPDAFKKSSKYDIYARNSGQRI